jgi:iron(II)-dependent oxidoreductase
VEDLSGNVWEWTRSLWGRDWEEPDFGYPYDPEDGRENLAAGDDVRRVARGGSFDFTVSGVRCAYRGWYRPRYRNWDFGFRVVVSPFRRAQHGDTSDL